MKLSRLLELHRKNVTAPGVLPKAFGDGYLCVKNRNYRVARERALKLGFRFSTEQNDAYRSLPLSQLETVLKNKVIPYIDNTSVLAAIEKKIPGKTEWVQISDNLKGNSVFHESCHAWAHSRLQGVDPALRMLIEESFANCSELLSILDADDQAHRHFLELNSYVYMLEDRVHLMNAEKAVGFAALSRWMLLSYLHANYLRETVDFDRMLNLSLGSGQGVDTKTRKNLRILTKIAFELNPRFRELTTKFHFNLVGVPLQPDVDFLGKIEESPQIRAFLERDLHHSDSHRY